jgi:hypothetical protein
MQLFEKNMAERSRVLIRLSHLCRITVIVLVVGALTASLATRYTTLGPQTQKVAAVKSQSSDIQKQRLLSNALQWTAPAPTFSLFQPPRTSIVIVSVFIPFPNLGSESWLYNRPPPSC